MSNLADMVTGALNLGEGEPEEIKSAPETASETYLAKSSAWEALQAGRDAEDTLPSARPKEFHRILLDTAAHYLSFARSINRPRYSYSYDSDIDADKIDPTFAGQDLLLRAGDYLHQPSAQKKKEILTFLHQINDEMEIYLMRDIEGRLEYIRSIWDKDSARVISECCNVTKATASNWLRNNSPGYSARSVAFMVRVTVHLKSTLAMTDEEVREWFETPLDSKTPLEMLAAEYKIPEPIRDFLRDKGVVILDWLGDCPKN